VSIKGGQFQPTDARDAAWLRTIARAQKGGGASASSNERAPLLLEAENALAALYDAYRNILFSLLLRILNNRAEAEDVLQDVFVQVWQCAASFDAERGRPFTWLVTLARSRAIDRVRALSSRERTAQAATAEEDDAPSALQTADPFDAAERREQRERIGAALNEIPEEQRRVILLAYFEGLTQTEIAERLNEPLGTVKTRTRAALFKLRELLDNKSGCDGASGLTRKS
jgi:RNA polymerase sigma-70 factor (ECF subfamily)